MLTRSYPRHFAFYVARPTRSIHQNQDAAFPIAIRVFALAHSRRRVRAREPLTSVISGVFSGLGDNKTSFSAAISEARPDPISPGKLILVSRLDSPNQL